MRPTGSDLTPDSPCIVHAGYLPCSGDICLVWDQLSRSVTLMCERHLEWSNSQRRRHRIREFYWRRPLYLGTPQI